MVSSTYKGYRFPREIISHFVWLYHRFTLSFREIELLMTARGISVSYETIRAWCTRFGSEYARRLRRRAPRPGDKWHLDEVFVKIGGVRKYLWRAVDQHGNVLDILIQSKRDGKAATRFFRKLLKKQSRRPLCLRPAADGGAAGGRIRTRTGHTRRGSSRRTPLFHERP